ncbi:MAG: ATP-binding protein [Acidimicrobiia bacterium]
MRLKAEYGSDEFACLVERESERIERKTGLGDHPLQDAFVAFSNTDGGVIFVGVRDNGEVVGRVHDQGSDDRIHAAALNARDVGRYGIIELKVAGKPVIAIEVKRREEGFSQTSDGRVLVRRGARNVALYGTDLTHLIQDRALRRFELVGSGVPRDAADEALVREVAEAFGWSSRASKAQDDRLAERGLLSDGELTVAGALFLTDPRTSLSEQSHHRGTPIPDRGDRLRPESGIRRTASSPAPRGNRIHRG